MDREQLKRQVAVAALAWVRPEGILGVGTGSTVAHLIDALAATGSPISAAVASSRATAEHLDRVGIDVVDLADVGRIDVYIDGADEVDPTLCLTKGGGGALTREKICAQSAEKFVCIVDEDKLVDRLGTFPLAIEVIPMASRLVAKRIAEWGGTSVLREGFTTDNGNIILDVIGLALDDPATLEIAIDSYPGVVTSGIFARRRADVVLVAGSAGVQELRASGDEPSTPPL